MGDGPPGFRRNSTCSAVLRIHSGGNGISVTGLLPYLAGRSRPLRLPRSFVTPVLSVLQPQEASFLVWAVPVSLAATWGIDFSFSSSGYLDVSVPRVCLLMRYEFTHGSRPITGGGFPHSEISGSSLTYSSPKHIGVSAVLLRLLVPRHPPCALSNLTSVKKDHHICDYLGLLLSMSCYPVFKEQA